MRLFGLISTAPGRFALLTPHKAKHTAQDLTLQHAGGRLPRLSRALFNASAYLNPHQIEAAMFALRSPLSRPGPVAGLKAGRKTSLKAIPRNNGHYPKNLSYCPANYQRNYQRKPMPDPNDMKDLKDLKALAVQMAAIRAEVQAEGGFLHDRDLHQCPACSLMEDVLFSGKLLTYWHQTTEPVDSGLRFKEVGADQLAYPCCGGLSLALDADNE